MEDSCKQIKCSVQNCHFNDNDMCQAEAIEVNAMGNGKVETSDGTCCSTFKDGTK